MTAKNDDRNPSRYDRQLILEVVDGETDGESDFYTDWLETADALRIRVAGFFPGSGWDVQIQESPDAVDGHFVSTHNFSAAVSGNQFVVEADLTARYFRVRVSTTEENICQIVVRAIDTIRGGQH